MSKEEMIMLLGSISECVRAGALNAQVAQRYIKAVLSRILDMPSISVDETTANEAVSAEPKKEE